MAKIESHQSVVPAHWPDPAALAQANATDHTVSRAGSGPQHLALEWQSTELLLWFISSRESQDEALLQDLPISAQELADLRASRRQEIHQLGILRALARRMTRSDIAQLLRARVNGMSLAARTPAEFAAVARAVRTLPDWVWSDVTAKENRPASASAKHSPVDQPQSGVAGAYRHTLQAEADALMAMLQGVSHGAAAADAGPLMNRHERRATESRLRKGK